MIDVVLTQMLSVQDPLAQSKRSFLGVFGHLIAGA